MKYVFVLGCFFVTANVFCQSPEERLLKAGIKLQDLQLPVANYVHAVRTGNLIYLSGKGPQQENGENMPEPLWV
jgi:enamine deaminase RidA (YjgF/YER057c/UK114 family)